MIILAILWSFEESGRNGIHTHSPLYVPIFQTENLRKLFAIGGPMQQLLLRFAEGLAMAYMPSAYHADEWRVGSAAPSAIVKKASKAKVKLQLAIDSPAFRCTQLP